MKVLINGKLYMDDYDRIHSYIIEHSSKGIGAIIKSRLNEVIQNTEWYHHTPQNFDLVHNFNEVQAKCGDDAFCFMDAFNWAIMNKSEITADIYRFITDRTAVIKDGIENNFIPNYHIEFSWFNAPVKLIPKLLDFIDWHFVLDCIVGFL